MRVYSNRAISFFGNIKKRSSGRATSRNLFVPSYLSTLFDGVNILNGVSMLRELQGAWALSVWVYLREGDFGFKRPIISNYDGTYGWVLGITGTGNIYYYRSSSVDSSNEDTISDTAIGSAGWYHILLNSHGDGTADFHINGRLSTSTTVGGLTSTETATAETSIGSDSFFSPARFYSGYIDEVSWYITDLTESEIVGIYNNGTPTNLKILPYWAKIGSWWRMGEFVTSNRVPDVALLNDLNNSGNLPFVKFTP